MLETTLIIIGIICLILGLLGTIYPALPGLWLMFAGAWFLAHANDYQIIGTGTLTIIGILAAIGTAIDFIAGMLGAKYTGASKQALWGAFIGGIVGMFFGVIGLLFGSPIGAAIGEMLAKQDLYKAGKVSIGTLMGFVIGTAAKIGCAIAMLLVMLFVWLSVWWTQ